MTYLQYGVLNQSMHARCHRVEEKVLPAVQILLGLPKWTVTLAGD